MCVCRACPFSYLWLARRWSSRRGGGVDLAALFLDPPTPNCFPVAIAAWQALRDTFEARMAPIERALETKRAAGGSE